LSIVNRRPKNKNDIDPKNRAPITKINDITSITIKSIINIITKSRRFYYDCIHTEKFRLTTKPTTTKSNDNQDDIHVDASSFSSSRQKTCFIINAFIVVVVVVNNNNNNLSTALVFILWYST
jgi:hypothetical protein